MITNLYGDKVLSLDDVCEEINKRAMSNGVYELNFNMLSEKQGFWFNPLPKFTTHQTPGFYAIFKNNRLEYIGYSSNSIGSRISRFVKEVNHKSRYDEGHPAANKWRRWNGSNFENCHVMFCEFNKYDIHTYGQYSYESIEKHLIKTHKPRLNIAR
jgi:hypothetical protein